MTAYRFEVKSYVVRLNSRGALAELLVGGAYIRCWGNRDKTAGLLELMEIEFLPAEDALPENVYEITGQRAYARLHLPYHNYPWYLDLLRNEGPVWAWLNTDVKIGLLTTGYEPVGEDDWS